jgi:hypothetical protein
MKYRHARLLINGQTPSELLGERLRDTAEIMGGMLKVNAFLNHQVDCHLMSVCGHGTRPRALVAAAALAFPRALLCPF